LAEPAFTFVVTGTMSIEAVSVLPNAWISNGATAVAAPETLPAPSACVADTVAPVSWTGESGTEKLPSPATVAVPSSTPPARTSTRAPGSPVPVSAVPSPLTVRPAGGGGAVRSGAGAFVGPDRLPAASRWVATSASPLRCGVVSVTR
jgi:hypothetical protein